MTKLENLNGHYMRDADVDALMADLSAYLPHAENAAPVIDWLASPENEARFRAALPGLKERAKTLVELVDSAGYLWASRPLTLDAKAEKQLDETARAMLGEVADRFDALEAFTAETTEACVRAFAEEKELKLGKVAQPLRAALTGRTTSPPVFDVLEVLGREESLARIRDQAAG
jgi:glutamyl-tRNA synthetase